jgi:hypothetical protein
MFRNNALNKHWWSFMYWPNGTLFDWMSMLKSEEQNKWNHQLLLHHAMTWWSPVSPSFWPLLFLEIFWNCTHKKSMVAATNPFFPCTQDLMWLRKNLQCSE